MCSGLHEKDDKHAMVMIDRHGNEVKNEVRSREYIVINAACNAVCN